MFSEPGQILACLEAIAADGEVEVVRVNNKLARSYDAALTAGYRCATHTHRTSLRHSVKRSARPASQVASERAPRCRRPPRSESKERDARAFQRQALAAALRSMSQRCVVSKSNGRESRAAGYSSPGWREAQPKGRNITGVCLM